MKHQSFLVVRFKNRVLIPTQSRMEGGGYLATNPVAGHDISDEQGIARSIAQAIVMGNPVVPHTSRGAWPESVLIAAAGMKSQAALERCSATWAVGCDGTQWHIYPAKPNAKGKWEMDATKVETHPADIPAEQLAERMVELVRNTNIPD